MHLVLDSHSPYETLGCRRTSDPGLDSPLNRTSSSWLKGDNCRYASSKTTEQLLNSAATHHEHSPDSHTGPDPIPGTSQIAPQAVNQQTYQPGLVARALDAFLALHANAVQAEYRGHEFDDFLAGQLTRLLTGNSLLLQRVAVQVGERLPINVRAPLGVPKLESTKARGFFAKGYLSLYASTSDHCWLEAATASLDWLLEHPSPGYHGLAWGNHFDFASRAGFFPKHLPTVVWSAHIAEAMVLANNIIPAPRYKEAIERVADFIVTDLGMTEDSHGVCLHYAPSVPAKIHNSNLLGAAILARASEQRGDPAWRDIAIRAYRWSLNHWQSDGSWLYGVGSRYSWSDNFHTAYVIESLLTGHDLLGEAEIPWSVIERSVTYWITNFFGKDGTPHYYNDRTYPLDIQCAAQAIETLSRLSSKFAACGPLASTVLTWTLNRMRKPNGAFRYQLRPLTRNNLESLHWGQATMLSALGAYIYHGKLTAS